MYTRAHQNRWWTLTLELLVLVHGVIVAIMNTDNMWHLFGFGLAGIFVVTQVWGLGLRRRTCWIIVAAYFTALVLFYLWWDIADLVLPFRILGGYFVALPVLAALIWPLGRLMRGRAAVARQKEAR
jgi:hypothetical protein